MRAGQAALLLLVLGALPWPQAAAEQREVRSCGQLSTALNDPTVHHVLLMPTPGGYNCTERELQPHPVYVLGRDVLLEGYGLEQVYVDFNQVIEHVLVGEGGQLRIRNIWADDCLVTQLPYTCLFQSAMSSRMIFEDMQFSDATCMSVKHSLAMTDFIERIPGYKIVNKRTLLVADTGWLDYASATASPISAHYRIINTTFTCTGSITHPLPDDMILVEVERLSDGQRALLIAVGLALLALMAGGLITYLRTKAQNPPEFLIAERKGFLLEETLGAGHFGRVIKARQKTTGQLVAVKILDLLPSQKRQVAAAWQECQLLSQLQHECIVKVITFYTAQVGRRQNIVESEPGNEYVQLEYRATELTGSGIPLRPAGAGSRPGSAGSSVGSGGSLLSGEGSCGSRSNSSGLDGIVSIQVQLVMQYCDMGTLGAAIKEGRFKDPETGEVLPRHILLTALEIARGLEYLHHPDRRLVHRDLSAPNVLLSTHPDERGFRALLSDFGLSTSLSEDQTHKTSEVKGTISYMSPEVFVHNDISPALDIYSLGIILHMMCAGADPYGNKTSAMIVLSKVRACEYPDQARLPPITGCPPEYQQLVWDCTQPQRNQRPTAPQVVQRLRAMLLVE